MAHVLRLPVDAHRDGLRRRETEFFERANMLDTKIGQESRRIGVAEPGFEAMMKGEADIVTGWKNKIQVAMSRIAPASVMAEQHREQAAPGTAER